MPRMVLAVCIGVAVVDDEAVGKEGNHLFRRLLPILIVCKQVYPHIIVIETQRSACPMVIRLYIKTKPFDVRTGYFSIQQRREDAVERLTIHRAERSFIGMGTALVEHIEGKRY